MRHTPIKRTSTAPLAAGLALVLLLASAPAAAFADEAPVEAPPAAPQTQEPAEPPAEEPVEQPAEQPVAPEFAAPVASEITASSVELRWLPPVAGETVTDFDVLVYLGLDPVEQSIRELDPAKLDPTQPDPQFDVLPAEKLAHGELGITVTGLTASTDHQFVVREGEKDAPDAVLSTRTETVRTLDAPAAAPDALAADIPTLDAVAAEAVAPAPELRTAARAAAQTAPTVTAKGGTALLVSWPAYDAIATPETPGYAVYSLTVRDSAGSTVKTQSANFVSTAVVTGLSPATAYSVEVQESSTAGSSGRSELVTTLPVAAVPGVIPGSATGQAVSASQILVSWPTISEGPEVRTYTVRAYKDGAVVATKTGVDPFTTGTSWTFANLLASTSYTFTVTAVGYDGTGAESGQSAPVVTAKGIPVAPATPTLVRGAFATGIVANWAAPVSDGGYAISGYRLEFYNPSSTSTSNLVRVVDVPATSTSYSFEETMIVASAIGVRVSALNAAGQSPFSGLSPALTIPAASAGIVTVSSIELSTATADGFTVSWTALTGATASTGYYLRVVEHIPGNVISNSSNYTYSVLDLGSGWATSGTLTKVLTGLEGGKLYQVAITAYTDNGGSYALRGSTARSNKATGPTAQSGKIATLGSTTPLKPQSKASTPTVTGSDSVQWSGNALTDRSAGGSPITGYRIELYVGGTSTPVQSVVAPTPSYDFTGLQRYTIYQVRYAGINANGQGPLSDLSDGVRTLLKPLPGSVAPRYTTLAELTAAIAAAEVTEVTAASVGLDRLLESNTSIDVQTPWSGSATTGEVWIYPESGAAAFRSEFAVVDGKAAAEVALGDLATGTYYLALYPDAAVTDGGVPVAVGLRVTRPITGPTALTDAVFRWGINNESNNGAFFGGCNFLVAGKAPDVGSASLFTPGRYSAQEGNVSIVKPNSAGNYVPATWENKCLSRTGSPVTPAVSTPFTESQVVITGGTGTVDPSTNSANLQWTGDFTVVFYGGLTFWYATDPKLVVENGVGSLTATLSGFGTDMDNQTKWEEISPREVTLATLGDVKLTSQGFVSTPAYLGVAVDIDATPQAAKTTANAAYWGSFPQDFVEFQALTGQLSYWYTSSGSQDPSKPTLPLYVGYDAGSFEDPDAGSGAGTGPGIESPFAAIAPAAQPPRQFLRAGSGSTQTTVADLATLLALIEEEAIARIAAADAGLPASFAIGQVLRFDFPWAGEATSVSIFWYPGANYAGSFRVVNGRVVVSIDSSVIQQEGEVFFVFFSDSGESVAVSSVASGRLEREAASLVEDTEVPTLALPGPIIGGDEGPAVLIGVIVGLGIVAAGAGVASVVILRRRQLAG